MDRFNQMSGQADLIAKKKLEIEAKRKAQQEAAQNSGSISAYNKLPGSSKSSGPISTSSIGQRQQKALPIGNLKNRWGFKGKSSADLQRPASNSTLTAAELKNTFSNDGSFLDQFKILQQKGERNQDVSKTSDERCGNFHLNKSKSSSQQSKYSIPNDITSHKDILSTPPPPPPSHNDINKKETSDKPKEADEWYKQALERARNIAKNLGQSSNTTSFVKQDAPYSKSTTVPPKTTYDTNQGSKYEPGLRPDFSVPPPPVQAAFIHQPPPLMKPEYGQSSNQPNFEMRDAVGERYINDNDQGGRTLYSPTKPTTTPTKTEVKSQETSKFENKVLLTECKFQPTPEPQSDSSVAYNPDNLDKIKDEELEDLKDIILSTVAEELASMVACSGNQLENIARNHNAGMDEAEMSYVL